SSRRPALRVFDSWKRPPTRASLYRGADDAAQELLPCFSVAEAPYIPNAHRSFKKAPSGRAHPLPSSYSFGAAFMKPDAHIETETKDRKSTRLNSSHVKISY